MILVENSHNGDAWGLSALEVPVRCVNLTDDELWLAIADNTNVMSALVNEQLEIDDKICGAEPSERAKLMRDHLETINSYQREYRDYTAELRRRYKIGESSGHRIAEESAKKILSGACAN
jgi:hypothetical protein